MRAIRISPDVPQIRKLVERFVAVVENRVSHRVTDAYDIMQDWLVVLGQKFGVPVECECELILKVVCTNPRRHFVLTTR